MKAFIFDMDGVLVDTQLVHSQSTAEALQDFGVPCTMEEAVSFAGTKRGVGIASLIEKNHSSADIETVCKHKDDIFLSRIHQMKLKPIEGIPALLKNLRFQGIHMAIASSSNDDFIAYIVDQLQIRSYFEELISGQNLLDSKPDPAIYLLAAHKLGVKPRDSVVLEDACMGVKAAKAAGMYCIGYRNPNSGQQDLSQADKIVEHIDEIDIEAL